MTYCFRINDEFSFGKVLDKEGINVYMSGNIVNSISTNAKFFWMRN